jgi:hypothetical protein
MLDRMSLSMKNEWIDKENKVYLFFTLEDIHESLNCSHTTGVKILAELDTVTGIGLIERVKQGQGRPTRIYVKNFILPVGSVENSVDNCDNNNSAGSLDFQNVEVKTSNNLNSRPQESGSADFQNVESNQTYSNKNNINHTENQSIDPSAPAKQTSNASQSDETDMMDTMEAYRALIHKNIEYEILIERYNAESINEYVEIMLDAICSPNKTVRVDRADYSKEVVKSRLLKLESSHIEYVLISMSKNTTKVKNIKNYLLTALYNSYTTMGNFFQSEVNHDLYGKK